MKTPQQILQGFLRAKVNSVSRERMFHNKLFFDLKLAGARAGYDLTISEPEVDRDGFDITLSDRDVERRIQLKTVLRSAGTVDWYSTKRFMRPEEMYGETIGWQPWDCGSGGGFVLIEIDDSSQEANVSYLYTDFFVATALAERLISETPVPPRKGRGRPKSTRSEQAAAFLGALITGNPGDDIRLNRGLFLRAASPDALLALLSLHNGSGVHLPADMILSASRQQMQVDANGDPRQGVDHANLRMAQSHMEDVFGLLNEAELRLFNAPPWPADSQ
jgi:hypothetical protein